MTTEKTVCSWFYEFKIFDLKISSVPELRMLESYLFYSIMVNEKYQKSIESIIVLHKSIKSI